MTRNRGKNLGIEASTLALAAVVLIALGAAVGIAWGPERVPASVRASEATSAPVSSQSFDDARQVKAIPQASGEAELSVGDAGRLTASACVPGGKIASGSSPVTIDDRPAIALATSVPPWRDLKPGAKGADVRALQVELARLGYAVPADGTYGETTRRAVTALWKKAGVARSNGSLRAASVLWLPAKAVVAKECAPIGAEVSDGPLVTIPRSLTALSIEDGPRGTAPGARMVRLGEASAPVVDGKVTDPDFLAAVQAGPEFAMWQRGDGTDPLTLEYVLAEPVDVAVIPPSALFALSGTTGCVIADGKPRPVAVVSSSLGRTFVTFEGGPAPRTVQLTPPDGTSCA